MTIENAAISKKAVAPIGTPSRTSAAIWAGSGGETRSNSPLARNVGRRTTSSIAPACSHMTTAVA